MGEAAGAVLDTNTVLSALLFMSGPLVPSRLAWQAGSLVLLLCAPTVEELLRVLAYPKFKLSAEEQQELLADYLPAERWFHRGPCLRHYRSAVMRMTGSFLNWRPSEMRSGW